MPEPQPGSPTKKSRLRTLALILLVAVLLTPCLFVGPTGRAFHTFRLRNFADHEAIRTACLPLLDTHPASVDRPVSVDSEDVPATVQVLGDRCFVTVTPEFVSVDLGSFWVDSYGFRIYRDVSKSQGNENELSPGVVWWDAG